MGMENRLDKVFQKLTYGQEITEWKPVTKIGDHYYTAGQKKVRRLTDEELAEFEQPGVGVIVVKRMDAQQPQENITECMEVRDD